MFTGIVETLGTVIDLESDKGNVTLRIKSNISNELKIDQSVSHNGVCLTVVEVGENWHSVTAIDETLLRSNIGKLVKEDNVNLERAMKMNARLDGHMVQGHVDGKAKCIAIDDKDGSWMFTFEYESSGEHILVDKGSICVNGVSLTVVSPSENHFSVAIIPYTYAHTTFGSIKIGDTANLEFDIIGKYIAAYMSRR